ncbi:hypothetical protein ABK040_016740 [Willaertia magna]
MNPVDEQRKRKKRKEKTRFNDDDVIVDYTELQSSTGMPSVTTPVDELDSKGNASDRQIQEILDIYTKNDAILNNLIKMSGETIEIGTAAAEKLKQQSERLNEIDKELDEMGSGLKRSKKELRKYFRGTNCDKAVVCLLVLSIIAAIAIIIVWNVLKRVCINGTIGKCKSQGV